MTAVRLRDKSDVDGQVAEIYGEFERLYGFVPNAVKALANCPDLVLSYVPLMVAVFRSPTVGPRERAIAALAVGDANQCRYCVSHISASGARAGLNGEELRAIVDPGLAETLGDREQLIAEFARTLARDGDVPEGLLGRMKRTFSDAELVNLTVIASFYNMASRINRALRIEVEEAVLASRPGASPAD